MKKTKTPALLLLVVLGSFFISCNKEPEVEVIPLETFVLSSQELSFTNAQETQWVAITSGSDWNAQIEIVDETLNQAPDWLRISKAGGLAGHDTLYVTTLPHEGFGSRTGRIKMLYTASPTPQFITVTQAPQDAGADPVAYLSQDILVQNVPYEVSGTPTTVRSEAFPLYFFGWGVDNDHRFTLNFPASVQNSHRVIMTYRMGAGPNGCSDWDHTTYFSFKYNDEWYEIARCVTPYGNSFGPTFEKKFYFDVTEYLPMLQGAVEFKLYYNGFDASATGKHHTAQLTFDFYQGTPKSRTVFISKLYDSEAYGNSGYRGFLYGRPDEDIEEGERMGPRTLSIPADVKRLDMRVVISGHGADSGRFPDRPGYQVHNAAEFDLNYYTVKVNGTPMEERGTIYISCSSNYPQSGTYYTDRANWCPGNPVRVERWKFINPNGITELDIDFERFEAFTRAENPASYLVQIVLFGYDN